MGFFDNLVVLVYLVWINDRYQPGVNRMEGTSQNKQVNPPLSSVCEASGRPAKQFFTHPCSSGVCSMVVELEHVASWDPQKCFMFVMSRKICRFKSIWQLNQKNKFEKPTTNSTKTTIVGLPLTLGPSYHPQLTDQLNDAFTSTAAP